MNPISKSCQRSRRNRYVKNKTQILKMSKKYHLDNRERLNKQCREKYNERKDVRGGSTCSTLKKHSENMKNDPESLSTEFMLNMLGLIE